MGPKDCKCYRPVCSCGCGVGACSTGAAGGLGGYCRSYCKFVSTDCCLPRKEWYAWHGPEPYIVHSCGGVVALVIPPCTVISFTYSEGTSSYESSPGGWTLVYSDGNYSVTGPTGNSWTFVEGGLFFSGPGENGNRIDAFDPDDPDNPAAYSYSVKGELKGTKITAVSNGVATTTAEVYTYVEGETGRIATVTLRRRVGNGSWEDLQRGTYQYYGGTSEHGLAGDVQAVTQQFYENGQWVSDRVSYFCRLFRNVCRSWSGKEWSKCLLGFGGCAAERRVACLPSFPNRIRRPDQSNRTPHPQHPNSQLATRIWWPGQRKLRRCRTNSTRWAISQCPA